MRSGPAETEFGIARVIELQDGSLQGEVFDEDLKSWAPSTNPALTNGEVSFSNTMSYALAERLGVPDDDLQVDIRERRADLARSAIESKYDDYTDAVVRRLSKPKTRVSTLRALDENSRLSGDDSGLEDVWEEFKEQAQRGESFFFGEYESTIKSICEDVISALTPAERMLLWLESDASYRWWEDEIGDPGDGLIQHDLSEEIYGRVWKRAADEELDDPDEPPDDEELVDEELDAGTDNEPLDTSIQAIPNLDLDEGFSLQGLQQRERMVSLGYDKRAILPSKHGMPVFDRRLDQFLKDLTASGQYVGHMKCPSDQEAVAAIREARRLCEEGPVNRTSYSMIAIPRIGLKLPTVKALKGQTLRVKRIADRWALGAPEIVKKMEADGSLLQRLKEQANLEGGAIADALSSGAFFNVPEHEILAMLRIPTLPE